MTSSQMRRCYQLIDPRMEAKSVRRGSLQAMAACGVDHKTLMLYSGHLQETTLLRYLNWGRLSNINSTTMAVAGEHLIPTHGH
jgi:hypothetical protein